MQVKKDLSQAKKIANRIKKRLVDLKVNQSELATRIHKSKGTVSLYLSGAIAIPEKTLNCIGMALDISPLYFIQDETEHVQSSKLSLPKIAEILGRNAQSLREDLKRNNCPYGYAIKKGNAEKYSYYFYTKKLSEYFEEYNTYILAQSDRKISEE
ncbi:hypothetical protein FACS189418_7600 [Clostridia bacterium]|nr:hypothetical protein FACS189418_7600 [Clostridia bacterium]